MTAKPSYGLKHAAHEKVRGKLSGVPMTAKPSYGLKRSFCCIGVTRCANDSPAVVGLSLYENHP